MGRASAWVRPDDRCVLSVRGDDEGVRALLIREAVSGVPNELLVNVAGTDEQATAEYATLGFRVARRESLYAMSVARAVAALSTSTTPPGIDLVSIADVDDEDRVRVLDDLLRQDVPGTEGWRWSADGFHDETYAPYMDPDLYMIGVERTTGALVAIARVWVHQGRTPRLGFVGVVPEQRRIGLAGALLHRIFNVLATRGVEEVSAEVDVENTASNAMMGALGAIRTADYLELVLPARDV